jgi:transcription elongation factor Elf1
VIIIQVFKCPDCDGCVEVPDDAEEGEIYSCSGCGLELEFKNGELIELTINGEDWGE